MCLTSAEQRGRIDFFNLLAAFILLNAEQEAVGSIFLFYKGAFLAHGQVGVHPDSQDTLLLQSCFPLGQLPVCSDAWELFLLRNSHFLEFYETPVGSILLSVPTTLTSAQSSGLSTTPPSFVFPRSFCVCALPYHPGYNENN